MQNAHERFGTLEFTKHMKDTTTCVRVYIDRVVLDSAQDEQGQAGAQLTSVIGGDSKIGALWAAVTEAAFFRVPLPGRTGLDASLGSEAQCFRGSLALPGRKRPGRHLVAVSAELAKTKPGAEQEGTRTILYDDDPIFVFYHVARRYGLPEVAEEFPGAVAARCSGHCHLILKANQEGFMRVVLRAWTSNPDYSTGCDYALVELGEEFARLALRRITVLRAKKALDLRLNDSHYWDSSAQFFSPWADCASEWATPRSQASSWRKHSMDWKLISGRC